MRRRSSSEICHPPTSLPEREPCPMVGREPSRRPHDNTPSGRHVFVVLSLCEVARGGVGPIRRNAEAGRGLSRKERAEIYHLLLSSELCPFACLGQAWVARSPLRRSACRSTTIPITWRNRRTGTAKAQNQGDGKAVCFYLLPRVAAKILQLQ
jgi:hypothetical protein